MLQTFLVLDFGSQFSQLVVRRLREIGVYSKLVSYDMSLEDIRRCNPAGIILSGGPNSVFDPSSPTRKISELREIAPIMGICYGMQLITQFYGGEVCSSAQKREYGLNKIRWKKPLLKRNIFSSMKEQKVWMSHGDIVKKIPSEFEILAFSENDHPAVIQSIGSAENKILCFQFHPEAQHTERGTELIEHFVLRICKAKKSWSQLNIKTTLLNQIKKQVPDQEDVLCALSGGVDSTVTATLLAKALGADRVHCVFVDTGLLRKNEFEEVMSMYQSLGLQVEGLRSESLFYERLSGVSDPEKKRKIIGVTFIDVFKKYMAENKPMNWLAQGTLYPDVIESISLKGQGVTIKSHHNVGGLPKDLNLGLVEPLRELYKDEVRLVGESLGISKEFLMRHPFPGPGLAIRILGEINTESIKLLQECDAIYIDELKKNNLYSKIWQAFCVLLPVRTVGVQGDQRSYGRVLALRAVNSEDAMSADWYPFDFHFLKKLSNRITNEVNEINRVVYDITSKPPGTIEWE